VVLSVLADGWKLTPLLLRRGRICKKKLPNGIIFHFDEKGLVTGELMFNGLREFLGGLVGAGVQIFLRVT
jgi:hypothetical protein